MTIDNFVDNLANCNLLATCTPNSITKRCKNYLDFVTNQYAGNAQTIGNLKQYLKTMFDRYNTLDKNKRILLVGEAAGYNGCRVCGIPFTSEEIIVNNSFFRKNLGTGYFVNKKPQSEKTAKIVWETFENFDLCPLLWNAFPFHPHKENALDSNREPYAIELEYGIARIKELIAIFGIDVANIYAVGEVACKALGLLLNRYIRHPSHGGNKEFEDGVEKLKNLLLGRILYQ